MHEYAQPGRLHREAEALAHRRRLGVERDLEAASEHRQRRARLEQCEVAARAKARAGAEGEEALLVALALGIKGGVAVRARVACERDYARAARQLDAGDRDVL